MLDGGFRELEQTHHHKSRKAFTTQLKIVPKAVPDAIAHSPIPGVLDAPVTGSNLAVALIDGVCVSLECPHAAVKGAQFRASSGM